MAMIPFRGRMMGAVKVGIASHPGSAMSADNPVQARAVPADVWFALMIAGSVAPRGSRRMHARLQDMAGEALTEASSQSRRASTISSRAWPRPLSM